MTDTELRECITEGQPGIEIAVNELYKTNLRPCITRFILNGGNYEDAKDIFQDSVIVLINSVQGNPEHIKGDLHSYLRGIFRLKSLQYHYSRMGLEHIVHLEDSGYPFLPEEHTPEIGLMASESEELRKKLTEIIKKELDHECQELLSLAFSDNRPSNAELAERLEIPTDNALSKKIRRCEGKVFQTVISNPEYLGIAISYFEGRTISSEFIKYSGDLVDLLLYIRGKQKNEQLIKKFEVKIRKDKEFRDFADKVRKLSGIT